MRELLGRVARSSVYTLTDDPSAVFFAAGMMIDADGALRAYHPHPRKGLDNLRNAGAPGNWWALVTDNGKPSGTPVIQGADDPAPGYYISTTSLEDTSKDERDPARYVDAERIPFFVLPGNCQFGASLGDFGVVVHSSSGKMCGGIYADCGPAGKIGEGSIALADALGVSSSPRTGGVSRGIAYVVFRSSNRKWPLAVDAIHARARDLFENWGGVVRLKSVLPELRWGQPIPL